MGTILVGGATGRVGGAALSALLAEGVDAVALIRSEERRAALRAGVERARVADFAEAASLDRAFSGAGRLLVCSAHGPAMEDQQVGAVRAAARAGVRRVVKISASPASIFPGTPAEAAAAHLAVEELLRAAVPEPVAIRPNAFMQVLLGYAQQLPTGVVRAPLGEAAVSWVDAANVGQVAAALLLADEAPEPIVEVTGPQALTMAQVCDAMAQVTGRPVAYEAVSDDAAREGMTAGGASPWFADHVLSVFGLFRARDAGHVTDAVTRYTGRPATTVAQFFGTYAHVLGAGARV
ncbi:MAG: NmrA family NAD(P)-binding protein [Solirubrobacteraceae bacterium]